VSANGRSQNKQNIEDEISDANNTMDSEIGTRTGCKNKKGEDY